MSLDKSTYRLIANILSRTYSVNSLASELKEYQNWERFVTIGSEQLVLPAIYRSLDKKAILDSIPNDLTIYLRDIYEINHNRNLSINEQLHSIAQLFKENNITYVVLKGCAIIQFLTHPDIGLRMVGDIDILIDQKEIDRAQKILCDDGYSLGMSFNYENKGFRHLNRLIRKDHIAAIELHSSILDKKYKDYISNEELLMTSILKNNIAICSEDHLITSIILSAQINNKGHYYQTINFKSIYDCLLLDLVNKPNLIKKLRLQTVNQSFIDITQYFFNDFQKVKRSKTFNKTRRVIESKFKYPQLFRLKLRIKWLLMNITDRITIFLTNSSYRRHVFKNKIFPIFN